MTSAHAIPTLFFDGAIDYTGGELSVNSVLVATEDIDPMPELVGSSLVFSAIFDEVDASRSNSFLTVGLFNGVAGDDLAVMDGDLNSLLTGDFSSLEMKGLNGRESGLVTGTVSATGGLLADMFGAGNLIALEFNLSMAFSDVMFDSGFFGDINGRIIGETVVATATAASVPEPGVLAMLGLGLALIGFIKTRIS